MNGALGAGVALSVAGVVGYVVGVIAPYPGRAFAITAVMLGMTLVAVGVGEDP